MATVRAVVGRRENHPSEEFDASSSTMSYSSQRSEILLVTSEFRRLVRRQRNVASQSFGALTDAIDKFLVALLHVLSLGFVSQLIYAFKYRQ